ncbi:MAG TPA: sterol desaturase family protein [Thermoanaerobaculia bacterium]
MNIIDLATWASLACLPLFLLLDFVHRARRFETPRFWRLRAFGVTAFSFVLSMAVPLAWAKVVGDRTLFDLAPLGIWGGAAVGILVYELMHYWYHRTVHRSDTLFRWVHQMHHSAESLDAWGAYYLSPLDVIGFSTLSSLVFFPLLGVTPAAGALAALFLTFNGVFQHANVRTPQWLGYLIQRPESHGVHHERGVHRYNYSDLPLWDIVFGTFRNPATFDRECGFYPGASTKIGAMLIGKDVSVPPPAAEPQPREAEAVAA